MAGLSTWRAARQHVRANPPKPGVDIQYHRHGGLTHAIRREGDEKACSCGLRWPAHEEHPK